MAADGRTISLRMRSPKGNILGRWLGVRAVPHLPCRFDCGPTVEFAESLLGRGQGCADEVDWLEEILSWSVEWSALHGIAGIKFPVLTVSTRTDATPWKYTVRLQGSKYPPEGASGLRFPYERPSRLHVSDSPSFQRGLGNPIGRQRQRPDWLYADNGFSSHRTMQRLHEPIVALCCHELAESRGHILDLGCGNGALLRKICRRREGLVPHGVDLKPQAIDHARLLLPTFADNFLCEDMLTTGLLLAGRFLLVMLMIGRLAEVSPAEARRYVDRLAARTGRLLVYMYPGHVAGRFEGLLARFELETVSRAGDGDAAIVRLAGARWDSEARGRTSAGDRRSDAMRGDRADEALEDQIACGLRLDQTFDRRKHALADEDLAVACLVAQPGGVIRDQADRCVVVPALETDPSVLARRAG